MRFSSSKNAKKKRNTKSSAYDSWWQTKDNGEDSKFLSWVRTGHQCMSWKLHTVSLRSAPQSLSMAYCAESDYITSLIIREVLPTKELLLRIPKIWSFSALYSTLHHTAARKLPSFTDLLQHSYVRVFLEWIFQGLHPKPRIPGVIFTALRCCQYICWGNDFHNKNLFL